MSATGTWNLTLKTPMGDQKMTARLTESGGTLTGTVEDDRNPTGAIKEGTVEASQVGWKFDVTKPFALTVTISAKIDGDSMTGTGKAGMFPAAPLSGTRG